MIVVRLVVVLILVSAGCATKKPAQPVMKGSEELYAHRWNLTELNGRAVTPPEPERRAHLLFTPGQVNKVSGSGGCNRITGTYELSGSNRITFAPLATTRMACPDMETESQFLKALAQATKYSLADNYLLLSSDTVLLARFTAAPAR
ncbi:MULTISPECIES: META domain-containing protein [Spirosoma]|uniref:META domain-containing protein n=1 Tax=Spirosoma sordidisoli TaxID=2502893 RepID=A0A4Q2UQK6_9BACT|nr:MULTISPECIES: META domain-containing protein [Spirosoma]RYC71814.1 META domain-containing protein [Spirosoma sordidisoli]